MRIAVYAGRRGLRAPSGCGRSRAASCKRIDCRERKSDFNSKPKAMEALRQFFAAIDCRYLVVSFSNEGYVSREEMEAMLKPHGDVYIV